MRVPRTTLTGTRIELIPQTERHISPPLFRRFRRLRILPWRSGTAV